MVIREANIHDVPSIARVNVDCWRTTYYGIIPDEFLKSLSYESREEFCVRMLGEKDKFCYVAEEEEGNIIGFASGGLERTGNPLYKGELYAIYILEDYQGKGIGRMLVQAVARRLRQWNIQSMLVWVLIENPFRYFYKSLGGKEIDRKNIQIGGAMLEEICYGWKDTGIILSKHSNQT